MDLQIDSVLKDYHNRNILKDIYLKMEQGEIVGLLGSNGSGKSTLFKIVMGLVYAEQQYVRAGKQILNKVKDRYRYIAYLPQQDFLPKHLTLSQSMHLYLKGSSLQKILDFDIVKDNLKLKPDQLSGGTQRFAEVLLVLYAPQPFILLDEPFSGLSPIMVDEVKMLIRQQSRVKGIIISDHLYRDVLNIAQRLYLLNQGSLREIKDKEALVRGNYISAVQLENLD